MHVQLFIATNAIYTRIALQNADRFCFQAVAHLLWSVKCEAHSDSAVHLCSGFPLTCYPAVTYSPRLPHFMSIWKVCISASLLAAVTSKFPSLHFYTFLTFALSFLHLSKRILPAYLKTLRKFVSKSHLNSRYNVAECSIDFRRCSGHHSAASNVFPSNFPLFYFRHKCPW